MQAVLASLRRDLRDIPGITVFMVPVQNLRIGTSSSKSQYQFVLQSIDQQALYGWAGKLYDALRADPSHFVDVSTDLQNKALQATLIIDRDKALELGVNPDMLRSSLYTAFGVRQVATIYTTSDSFQVIAEFDPGKQWSSERLDTMRIRSKTGTLIPVSAFARVERTIGPLTISQLGQIPPSPSRSTCLRVSPWAMLCNRSRRSRRSSVCRTRYRPASPGSPRLSSNRCRTRACSSWLRWSRSTSSSAFCTKASSTRLRS
jgi:hypothetical protein